ncbi:hypothetical protein HYPSUDRAFT_54637 [Hypholoma sublateritium FD-334 SS-4]|uniref:Uncharacterized protein n=1 Tax=Hypholoma sublateritium (strain FD-334 SS-4) TaxID=945553 RepID=A0A0D2MH91_HYPSF|nr:hypothetical protein HYPSUDRAFT_54637 [Hypholoma sublateritium FD-334 SS-4]
MHGYFLSFRLYDTARIIANPFAYEEQPEKLVLKEPESRTFREGVRGPCHYDRRGVAGVLEERDQRDAVEDEMNTVRDKLAALLIELQKREDEIDRKSQEIETLGGGEHQRIVMVVEEEWRGEVEEAWTQILGDRETESKDLREHINDLKAASNDLHAKFESL